eukprot:70591-Amphidinium_carterae.1
MDGTGVASMMATSLEEWTSTQLRGPFFFPAYVYNRKALLNKVSLQNWTPPRRNQTPLETFRNLADVSDDNNTPATTTTTT